MSTLTTNLGLTKPAAADRNWGATMNANLDLIDAAHTNAHLALSGGTFDDAVAVVVVHTGTSHGVKLGGATNEKLGFYNAPPIVQPANSLDLVTLLTNLGLRASGGNPPLNLGTGAITCGALSVAGDVTIADAKNLILDTTTGTKIGNAASQKLGFWNATPIVQPSSSAQEVLTNSTGGSINGTLSAVGATNSSDQSGVINDNFAELHTLLNAIRAALVATGLIKGSA